MAEQLIQHPKNIYEISTANNLNPKAASRVLWPIDEHVSVARRSGYDGIELWPTRPTPLLQIKTGLISPEGVSGILSVHQSPRRETLREAVTNPGLWPVVVSLPKLKKSLDYLEAIAYVTGDVPAVLYKETPDEFHQKTTLRNRLIQPDPELFSLWDAKSAEDFVDKVYEHGFTGICLDTNHLRRRNRETGAPPSELAQWQETVPVFLKEKAIKEIHVAVGRLDFPALDQETSVAEVRDLLYGTTTTDAVKILHVIADSDWKGNIVLEVLPSAIQMALDKKGIILSKRDLTKSYESIRESLYQIFDR